jgi:SAM-dependent methyltransferase
MFASYTRPLCWLNRIVLVFVAFFVLLQVVVRVLRRAAPGPMPSRLAPVLTTTLRSWLFGTPERVLDRAGVTPGMRVLEVGPGPGVYTVPLARRVASSGEDGGVTCLEIQPEMITMLRERLQAARIQNAQVVQGDGRQMPLSDDSFDLVFPVDVVGEVPDKPAFFRECARVLKPGGTLAVTEQINDPDFRLPSTARKLATDAGLREEGLDGLPWWTYAARYRK